MNKKKKRTMSLQEALRNGIGESTYYRLKKQGVDFETYLRKKAAGIRYQFAKPEIKRKYEISEADYKIISRVARKFLAGFVKESDIEEMIQDIAVRVVESYEPKDGALSTFVVSQIQYVRDSKLAEMYTQYPAVSHLDEDVKRFEQEFTREITHGRVRPKGRGPYK